MGNEWISVKERLPEESCIVFLEEPESDRQVYTAHYHKNIVEIGGRFAFDMPKVTHWMPLPLPPKEGE